MIIFNNLEIQSFKSIFKVKINFSELAGKFYSFEGKNYTVDFASSNGAGKSTVWDALSYVLYGTTMGIYLKKDEYQNVNTKIPLKLVLDFLIDCGENQGSYKIERTLTDTKLYKDNENVSELNKSDTEKKILNIINLTKEEFFSFTYLTQTAGGNFLGKTASEKLAVIKDFIFGEELIQIKNKIDNLIKDNDKLYKQYANEVSRLEGSIESLQKIINKNEEDNWTTEEFTEDIINENKNKIIELQTQQGNIRAYKQKKQKYESELKDLKQQMAKLKQQLEKVKNNICPTCGQHLKDDSVESSIRQEAKEIKTKAYDIKQQLTDVINTLQQYSDESEISVNLNNLIKINSKYETLQKVNDKQQQIKQEIDEKSKQLTILQDEVVKLQHKQKQIKDLQKYFNTTFIQYVQQSFLSEIENYLNLYCYEVFNDSFTLKFLNNSLELYIGNHPYSYFSGGERQRIDLLFVFAIKVALSNFTDKCTNLLILDESLSGSDVTAFDNIIEILDRLSNSCELSTILISHRETSNVSQNKIILSRYEDKTKLEVINS